MGLVNVAIPKEVGPAADAIGQFFRRATQSLEVVDETVREFRGTGASLRQVLDVAHAELLAWRQLRIDLPRTFARALANALETRPDGSHPDA